MSHIMCKTSIEDRTNIVCYIFFIRFFLLALLVCTYYTDKLKKMSTVCNKKGKRAPNAVKISLATLLYTCTFNVLFISIVYCKYTMA